MHVATKIIRKCTEAARGRDEAQRVSKPRSRPDTPSSAGVISWTPANALPKASMTADSESGYGTDTERSETYLWSPKKATRSGFKCLETPRSVGMRGRFKHGCTRSVASSPYGDESESSDDCRKRKRNPPKHIHDDYDSSSTESSKQCATPAKKRKASGTPVMTAESAAVMLLELRLHDAALRGKGGETRKRRASA